MDDLLIEIDDKAKPADRTAAIKKKQTAMAFWQAVSLDPFVRSKLQEEGLAFKLYGQI